MHGKIRLGSRPIHDLRINGVVFEVDILTLGKGPPEVTGTTVMQTRLPFASERRLTDKDIGDVVVSRGYAMQYGRSQGCLD